MTVIYVRGLLWHKYMVLQLCVQMWSMCSLAMGSNNGLFSLLTCGTVLLCYYFSFSYKKPALYRKLFLMYTITHAIRGNVHTEAGVLRLFMAEVCFLDLFILRVRVWVRVRVAQCFYRAGSLAAELSLGCATDLKTSFYMSRLNLVLSQFQT